MKTIYYWEGKEQHGRFTAITDAEARRRSQQLKSILTYREGGEGKFIIVWDKTETK